MVQRWQGVFGRSILALALLLAAAPSLAQPAMHMEASVRQPDGKILVAGQDTTTLPRSFVVGRVNADGTMDTAFGSAGWTQYAPATNPSALKVTAVSSLADGGVLVAAEHDGNIALLKLTSAGGLDTTFGSVGGFLVDDSSPGVQVNAISEGMSGTLLGFGSASASWTGSVTRAAVVRFFSSGWRDTTFGTQLPIPGESEFRAVARTWSGGVAAAGYTRQTWKSMLVALFNSDGQLDTTNSFGNHTGMATYGGSGFNFEAFRITSDDSTGDFVLVGRDGHWGNGSPQSYMTAVWFSWQGLYYRVERRFFAPDIYGPIGGDSTGMSIEKIAGTNDWLMAGNVVDGTDGRAYFGYARISDPYSYSVWSRIGPRTADDHVLVAAFPSGSAFVAVGTREAATGDFALRLRHFLDNGDFDTDFAQASPDATPNAFQFSSGGYTDAASGSTYYDIVRVTGIDVATSISVQNASYSISGAGYCDYSAMTAAPGMVANGQYVCMVVTAATSPATTVTGVLNVGGVQASLPVTTGNFPDTTFTGTPSNPSGGSVTFTWTVDPFSSANTSECRLDGAPFAACSSNSLSNLAEGTHTFQVRGVNDWGPDPTPASYTWSVLLPADTTILSGPPARSNASSAVFTFSASRSGPSFECSMNGAAFTACTSGQAFAGLSQGSQWFRVRAVDAAGPDPTPAEWRWTTDYTAPTVQLFASATGAVAYTTSTTATFNFSVNDAFGAGVAAQCQLDGGVLATCTSPFTQASLSEGQHLFSVRAVDAAGNVSAASSHSWTIDFTPPDTTIVSGPSGPTPSSSATFTFAAESGSTFECRLDSGAWAACGTSTTFSNLSQGSHVLEVRARDATGNLDATPASRSWTVDTAAPDITITSMPAIVTSSTSATFAFQSADAAATFECALDNAASSFSACTSPTNYAGLPAGQHQFWVRSRDAAGNFSPTAPTHAWTVDTTAGDTSITSGPASYSSFANASFNLSSTESNSTFECRLDAGAWTGCGSTPAYSQLADGAHTFEARSKDMAGNVDPTPAVYAWTIDTTPPVATVTSGPSQWTSATTVSLTFTANKPGSTFLCWMSIQGSGYSTPCDSPISYSGFTQQGNYIFQVSAVDPAGRSQTYPTTYEWNFDNVPPDTLINSGPGAIWGSSATFTFSSYEPASTFECRLDGAAFAACTSPVVFNAMSEGSHTFQVRAIDRVGQVDATPSSLTWTVDTTAPETTITSGPSGATAQTAASVSFTSPESGSAFECSLDAAAFASCTSPVNLTGLANGAHTFRVRAKDALGNADATPATASWTVDTIAPDTSITASPPPATNGTSASFSFAAESGSTFECKLDAGSYAACTSPNAYSSLANGSHTFSVRARDAVGNVDASPAAFTWTIDTVAPNTTITGGPSGNNNPNSATFTFTSSEANSTFQCQLDTGAFATCASPKAYAGLVKGSHTFQVRAIDSAGNVDATPATRTWTSK